VTSNAVRRRLLALIEMGGYPDFRPLYERLGYEVVTELSARRAQARLREFTPDVIVADFYKRYFHDRVSNLESLLALKSRLPHTRIIVIYDPFHQVDVEQLRERCPIDAALPLPVTEQALEAALTGSGRESTR
jgi:DNA-binding NarL/FixJ family response regulator